MYESWCKDLEEKHSFARSYTVLGGSFVNQEMAHKLIKQENPDFESSEEDFERVSQAMVEANKKQLQTKKRRRRKAVRD